MGKQGGEMTGRRRMCRGKKKIEPSGRRGTKELLRI
jgi:hypothetical protein